MKAAKTIFLLLWSLLVLIGGHAAASFTRGAENRVWEIWGERLAVTPGKELQAVDRQRENSQERFKLTLGCVEVRYYDPRLGRWLSRDPMGESGGFNLYAYCGNDPVNRHDSLGFAWSDGALIEGGWTPIAEPYYDEKTHGWMVKMRHVTALTFGLQQNVTKDSVMPLDQAKRLAPSSSMWLKPLPSRSRTLLSGSGFQGADFGDISNYIENHPGYNMELGVLESAPFALAGGYVFGGVRAMIGARAAGYLGTGLLGASAAEWAKGGFKVTPRGVGQVLGGLPAGGALVADGEAQGAAVFRWLADGGGAYLPGKARAGMMLIPFDDFLGEGPEISAINSTSKYRAGLAAKPFHHIFPQESDVWFAERGINVDDFTIELAEARHQAIHGGGNWRLGRISEDEWNNRVMRTLIDTEENLGRRLDSFEILHIGYDVLEYYGLDHLELVPYPFKR